MDWFEQERNPIKHNCEHCEYQPNDHMESVNEKIKDYIFEECEYKSCRFDVFEQHMRAVHNVSNPFKLNAGQYRTNNCSNLYRHINGAHAKPLFNLTSLV